MFIPKHIILYKSIAYSIIVLEMICEGCGWCFTCRCHLVDQLPWVLLCVGTGSSINRGMRGDVLPAGMPSIRLLDCIAFTSIRRPASTTQIRCTQFVEHNNENGGCVGQHLTSELRINMFDSLMDWLTGTQRSLFRASCQQAQGSICTVIVRDES